LQHRGNAHLLSFTASVGVDDAFANLGVPYGATDTPANAYTTFLAGVGVDDVFANVAGVGAVAGIGDPITTLGHTGDGVEAGPSGGTDLLGSGPSLETTADAPAPLSNQLSFVASVGVDDAFASLDELTRLNGLKLVPGMPVEAFIRTDERTMLSYLFNPLSDQARRAFREK